MEPISSLRIALVSPLISKNATGLSSYIAALVPRLCDAGHQVTVIASDCGYRGAEAGELVAIDPRAELKLFTVCGPLDRRLYRCPELKHWMQQSVQQFDVVDVQVIWSCIAVDAARACVAAGVPFVLTPHGMMTRWDWSKQMTLKRIFFATQLGPVWRRAHAIRYLSQGELDSSVVMPPGRYTIIPNAMELPSSLNCPATARFARERLGLSDDAQLVLFLGRVTPQKGVIELLQAFERIAVACPRSILAIAGPLDGEYGEQVRQRAASMAYGDRVRVLGPVFGGVKSDLFAAASVFVTLSKNEGLSIAALEALSFGVPAVLTRASNLPEVELGGGGVITGGDPAVAANALIGLLRNPSRLEQMRGKARRIVERNFSWQAVMPKLSQLYFEVAATRAAAAARSN